MMDENIDRGKENISLKIQNLPTTIENEYFESTIHNNLQHFVRVDFNVVDYSVVRPLFDYKGLNISEDIKVTIIKSYSELRAILGLNNYPIQSIGILYESKDLGEFNHKIGRIGIAPRVINKNNEYITTSPLTIKKFKEEDVKWVQTVSVMAHEMYHVRQFYIYNKSFKRRMRQYTSANENFYKYYSQIIEIGARAFQVKYLVYKLNQLIKAGLYSTDRVALLAIAIDSINKEVDFDSRIYTFNQEHLDFFKFKQYRES